MHHHSRSTRWFKMESKDRQVVRTRVVVRWKVVDPIVWILRKGPCHDIFDAIEENVQALLLESVAGNSYEQCMSEAGRGFTSFEKSMKPKLRFQIESLGGKLLGFEIRDLRFPLISARNKIRAEKEAKMKEQILEAKRQLEIETAKRTRENVKREFQMIKAKLETTHATKIVEIQSAKAVENQIRNAKLEEKKAEIMAKVKQIELQAKQKAQAIQQEIALLKAKGEAERKQIIEKAKADVRLLVAKADAKCETVRAEASAKCLMLKAEAQAKGSNLIGKAYKSSPGFVELENEKMKQEIMGKRSATLEAALTRNKAALMSYDTQRELALLEAGFSPIAPVAFKNGHIAFADGPEGKVKA
mmetsp:Transcript_9364/g.11200  ORF Transcript_9364/g.11200 Transcript_9364/m.11200 type:complete len:359 (-) Transcript_9364:6-1082(-)